MSQSNMSFSVDNNALVLNILDGEIKARMMAKSHPELKSVYKQRRIIDSTPAVTEFMKKHSAAITNRKLIHSDGSNFFGGIMQLSPLSGTKSYNDMLRNRMIYEYDLSEEEADNMSEMLDDLNDLKFASDIREIASDTEAYKKDIEKIWRLYEPDVMGHVKSVLGYEPEKIGRVSTYIMYPTFSTHRSCPISDGKTSMFFAKSGETDPYKIVSYLSHQAVHQPMLPYKSNMTRKEKEEFHAFVKFLTDKDVYSYLTGKSYLDIVTEKENSEVMGKLYPYFLGYRYRSSANPAKKIEEAIKRDKKYYDALPEGSKKKKLFGTYEFEKLDPLKIASMFREKKGITPYEFSKLDFEDKSKIYLSKYVKKDIQR